MSSPLTVGLLRVVLHLPESGSLKSKRQVVSGREHIIGAGGLVLADMQDDGWAQVQGERKLVAAVIYNRLHERMPLGIDATIRYGLDVPGTEALRVSQLESDNPYNTRNRTGLPPTPIANPGVAALEGAAKPADVPYFYFVAKSDGTGGHAFAVTIEEHEANRVKYGNK